MASSTIITEIKRAIRISHNQLDDEIARLVNAAKAELIRSGCVADVVNEPTDSVREAIITYCLSRLAPSGQQERYEESFRYQQDCLRKSR